MWTCAICTEVTDDDSWETCWKCGTPKTADPEADHGVMDARQRQLARFRTCGKCDSPMRIDGFRDFHEGRRMGVLGAIGELLVDRESLVVYYCPRCGKIDFYRADVGGEFRGDESAPGDS